MRFVQGFDDGSGMTHVRDMTHSVTPTILGRTVAVTSWGCSCCQSEETQDRVDMAARIAKALNVLEAVERITVIRTVNGAPVIGPEGWDHLQAARGIVSKSMAKRLKVLRGGKKS